MLEQPEAINATTQSAMTIVTAEKFYGLANQQGSRHSMPEPPTTMAQASRVKRSEAPSSIVMMDEDIVFPLSKDRAAVKSGAVLAQLLENTRVNATCGRRHAAHGQRRGSKIQVLSKLRELLETPESRKHYNAASNGNREGQKVYGLGNQQPSLTNVTRQSIVGHLPCKEETQCQYVKSVTRKKMTERFPLNGEHIKGKPMRIDNTLAETVITCGRKKNIFDTENKISQEWQANTSPQRIKYLLTMDVYAHVVEKTNDYFSMLTTKIMTVINTGRMESRISIPIFISGWFHTNSLKVIKSFVITATSAKNTIRGSALMFAKKVQRSFLREVQRKRLALEALRVQLLDCDMICTPARVGAAQ